MNFYLTSLFFAIPTFTVLIILEALVAKRKGLEINRSADVISSLKSSVAEAIESGVPKGNIIVDPGIGFGKTPDHNLTVLAELAKLKTIGCPMLIGTSRKSTLGLLLDLPPDQRVEGTAATVALAIAAGADIVRVHDVKEMIRVCRVTDAVIRGWRPKGWTAS